MNRPETLEPLLGPIMALQRLIESVNNRGVVIGGVAASILGKPRLTADADAIILLPTDDIPDLIARASQVGLIPRLSDAEAFARRSRVLLLRHTESGIDVDISLGLLPFEIEAVERSHEYTAGSLRVRLPTPEDLIILKAVAHRPKDMLDIAAVVASQPILDKQRIRFWVGQFAELLDSPELAKEIDAILEQKF